MAQEYVFRFLSVRPANTQKKRERAPAKTPLLPDRVPDSELRRGLAAAHGAGAGRNEVRRLVAEFKRGNRYVRDLDALPFDVRPGLKWAETRANALPPELNSRAELEEVYGRPLDRLAGSQEFTEALGRLADTLLAETLLPAGESANLDQLTAAYKLLLLIVDLAAGVELPEEQTIGELVASRTLVVPSLGKLPLQRVEPPPPPPSPPPDPAAAERERIKNRIADLEAAHRELANLALDPKALYKPTQPIKESARLAALEGRMRAVEGAKPERDLAASAAVPPGPQLTELRGAGAVVLAHARAAGLSGATKRALSELKVDTKNIDPVATVGVIERELDHLASRLPASEAHSAYLVFGGARLEVSKLKESLGIFPGAKPPAAVFAHPCSFRAGVGDLLLVKQTLKAYELAEFAHVENVLAGESRLREHRRLNIREEIEVSEEERETEKERDLQSTERNEMQSEAERTVKSQFELEAGLQVSGSYGPAVSFSASLNASFSTTTEETQRKAVSYSREVTEKTSERVRERVRRELRRRLLEEIQEINRHSIDNSNAAAGHVRGIYRWLNKVYDAQIFNYGQRMMYEFVVPEPAAYFLYALIENPPQDMELVKPDAPTYFGAPLKPSHLTRGNYHDYVARYQVRNAPAPPPEFQHVAYFDKQDKVEGGTNIGRAGKIEVPTGYEGYAASVLHESSLTEGKPFAFHVMLGNTTFDCSSYWGADYKDLGKRYKELAVAYHLFNTWSFTLGVDVYCRITAEGFAKWQQQVYDAIVEAYLVQKAQYDEQVAALAIQKGIPILGRNPLENRRLEREELKKLVLMMLTGSNDIALDSFYAGSEPLMRLDRACPNGSRIRFFENAFEWTNMLYILYPYFWGRKPRWISALHLTDPDLEFAAFLKSGAARVQVPVRPGFERAVAHFCQFGEIWEGNDAPLLDDDLYVPVVDEIAANLGKLDDGVPYPPGSGPWEVRIPTSLVLLQDLDEIPGIRDILTGANVDVGG
ncbi:MAG TPA: hypothetical protein VF121_16695 [Thermoanaerobaculia bacterium]|nr:hypothetical protein [Thermoanaerobaculia bacterium]